MEQHELRLVEKYAAQDTELKALWEDHVLFEKQLAKLESKAYLTPVEEKTVKELKKQKLDGKTRLLSMLERYRSTEV